MLRGVCIDTGLSGVLQKGNRYFLQEHGKKNYYVSRFNNPNSYFGSFRKELFELTAETNPKLKRFIARVSASRSWYKIGDEYIVTEKDHNGYFHVYSKKRPNGCPLGSYLDNFFEVIEPYNGVEVSENFKDITFPEANLKEVPQEESIVLGQMNLFEFIDA